MIEESLLKSNFIGKDGFIWWIGQIADPSVWRNEKSEIDEDSGWAYRCKVRIVGYHTFDGGILPDEDLPWAHVMVDPVDGSGQGALGKKHNLVGGETALGFFLDGEDAQQPVVVGLIYRNKSTENLITPDLVKQSKSSQFRPFTGNQGNMAIRSTQKRPVKVGKQNIPEKPTAPPAIVGSAASKNPIPVNSTIPTSDNSSDKIFPEDSALNAALKEAASIKIIRENGCSDNVIGKITQELRNFVEVINGLQSYRTTYIDPILNKAVDITQQIKSTASRIAGLLKSMINIMRGAVMGLISKLFRQFVALIVPEPQVPITAEASKNILNIIFCLFERLLDYLLSFIEDMLRGLIGRAISVPLCAAEEWIAALLGRLLELLDDLLEPILSGLEWLTGALDQVSDILSTVSGIANKIISFIGCDQLKCETPSQWAMDFGPSQAEADSWSRVLDNLDVLKSFNIGMGNALGYLSLYGYGDSNFIDCYEQISQEPPFGVIAERCRPPVLKIFGDGIGASAVPIVSNNGQIIGVEVLSGGLNYTKPPRITIEDKSNYGKGARAQAIVENGSISDIYIIKPGRGYCPGNYSSFITPPYYVATADSYNIKEGQIVTITIQGFELNTIDSYNLTYKVSGFDPDEIDGAALSGNINLNSGIYEFGTYQLQFRPLDDSISESFENLVVNIYDSNKNNVARVTILVTDFNLPDVSWWPPNSESPPGNPWVSQGLQGIIGGGTAIQGIQGTADLQIIQGTQTGQGIQGIIGDVGGGGIQGIVGFQVIQGITAGPIDSAQGIQGSRWINQGIQERQIPIEGIQGIQGITGIGTNINIKVGTGGTVPVVVTPGVVIVSPGTGYTSGDKITVGGIGTFIPIIGDPGGGIIGVVPDPVNFPINADFDSYPTTVINTSNGEGAAVFPILRLKRKFRIAPLVINQNGILSVVDCI